MLVNNGMPAVLLPKARWRKSRVSNPTGSCVELAELPGDAIAVRNSRDQAGPVLIYPRAEVAAFLHGLKNGEFDALIRLFGGLAPSHWELPQIGSRHSGRAVISCCVRPTARPAARPFRLPRSVPRRPIDRPSGEGTERISTGPGAWMSVVQPSDAFPGEPPVDEPRGGPTVLRIMLGTQLRRLREAKGITPDQAGYEIRGSRSKISRIEHGRVGFKERDVEDLLTLYGVTDDQIRAGMLVLARQANTPGWWAKYNDILPDWFEPYLGLETAASLIRIFELQFVHGLFQTQDYARAVTALWHGPSTAEETERRVTLRMQRQALLTSPDPARVWFVIDEAALRRPIGGRQVMRGQLNHLLTVAELPHVTLQIVPFRRGGHAGAGGSFTILRFAAPDLPDVVYLEQLTSALYLDERKDVDHYMEVMNRLSAEAHTPVATTRFLKEIIHDI